MNQIDTICHQFGTILRGKGKASKEGCTVELQRQFNVTVQGKSSKSVLPAGFTFESLDQYGNALNLGEIAILEEEIPAFTHSIVQQGITISALHNHWIFMKPNLLYLHIQSVEPPLNFARKVAHSFQFLRSYPISKD